MTYDDFDAQVVALCGEIEFCFPDPVDAFEDVLVEFFGLARLPGLTLAEWRVVRSEFTHDREAAAEPMVERAVGLADRCLAQRATDWPY